MKHDDDILIIGAGPAGLSFARALAGCGLRVSVLEKAPESALVTPKPDGRDIALTRASQAVLQRLGIWNHLTDKDIAPLREARVLNGTGGRFVRFAEKASGPDQPLGVFVPNDRIRRAAYRAVNACPDITLRCGQEVVATEPGVVHLAKGKPLRARLVVAADSRFSPTRQQVGIATARFDFGRTCIVARVRHAHEHGQVAYECFRETMTLAVLPQHGNTASIVLTLPPLEADEALALPPADFGRFLTEAFLNRLGPMTLTGTRHSYPLVATYATRFCAERFALIGDAAVGMHPITAHGFNFGLRGAWTLAQDIRAAAELGLDIGSAALLRRYERAHRQATLPLFLATNALVELYGSSHPLAHRVQDGLIRLGARLSPVRSLLMRRLTRPWPGGVSAESPAC